MRLISEFRKFIARGNVVDLAIAVVIGAAFNKIVTALVDGVIMPTIATITGGVSVDDWKYVVKPARVSPTGEELAEVAILYGHVLQTVIDFLLISFVIFLVLRVYNRVRSHEDEKAEKKPIETPEDVKLLREIRDLLKQPRAG
ncbi:large-conductance mechanosensitive channel protein MscL [Cognatilysobacter bugurensis]|uniref:Large-conductance mechanosensitive channel n=1 Tax=Cognatilysobacter bugurensis TaxID=543356 RepID=A0A918WBS7_9GAMM|nr:large-conductance mechanosensitive channel protein MscL [Lysobacter bugurensis]GHA89237.1 large-conductance mechanosensitive channel [Lysobacter bugurensis]